MRLGTKRYFCGGCGAVVDGPGRYCKDACVAKARASAAGPPLTAAGSYGLDLQCRCLPTPEPQKAESSGYAIAHREIRAEYERMQKMHAEKLKQLCVANHVDAPVIAQRKPDFAKAMREGIAAAEAINARAAEIGEKLAKSMAPFAGMPEFLDRFAFAAGATLPFREPTRPPRR